MIKHFCGLAVSRTYRLTRMVVGIALAELGEMRKEPKHDPLDVGSLSFHSRMLGRDLHGGIASCRVE